MIPSVILTLDIYQKFCVVYHKLLLHTVLISSVLRLVFILYSCTLTQVGVKCQKTVWYILVLSVVRMIVAKHLP